MLRLAAVRDNAAMEAEPPEAEPPKRKRRWYQFSLRTLMIFTLICALGAEWLGRKLEHKRREQHAVETLVKWGGEISYDYEIAHVSPAGSNWLRSLLGENFFNEVEFVDLSRIAATDDDLENLRRFPQLQELHLNVTWISDGGLEKLKELTRLRTLDLSGTKISDVGLPSLKGLTSLRWLELTNTDVSDGGLASLKDLTQLEWLDLSETKVTDAGVNDLQKSLPRCRIDHRKPSPPLPDAASQSGRHVKPLAPRPRSGIIG